MRQKCLLAGGLVAYLLAAIVLDPANGNTDFSFYKLSMRWPPSACNGGTLQCKPNTLGYFTIHGLWPTFENDEPVPKYDPNKNKCTDVTPTAQKDLLPELQSIEEALKKYWPNYKNHANLYMCAESWKHEWVYHGICSEYPANKPLEYFSASLEFANSLDYDPLQGSKVEPGEKLYTVKDIIDAVKQKTGATPQIQCNKNGETLQLLEIRVCFTKGKAPTTAINCPNTYAPGGAGCQKETDAVKIPLPPSIAQI
ncbi:hypothetical protein DITRI_Ditri16bG0127900 [Diplodiscus trichospermus]